MKDLIILGNGMAGMTAALYASRAGLDFKIVSRGELDFGQIGDAILVENYPCVENQSGFDLAMHLHEQLENLNVIVEEHEITDIFKDKGNNLFVVEYEDGTIDTAKTVIYALGARHRELLCEKDPLIHIHYCALCDGNFYQDKDVGIIGGGDSAFSQAEYLSKICRNVSIIMCDENITANQMLVDRVSKIENINIYKNWPVHKIDYYTLSTGEKRINCITFSQNEDYLAENGIVVDGVFVAIGMNPNTLPLYSNFNWILDKNGNIIATEDGWTPIEGLFAAGDVRQKEVRQSITAAADGANAVQSVIKFLKSWNKSQD